MRQLVQYFYRLCAGFHLCARFTFVHGVFHIHDVPERVASFSSTFLARKRRNKCWVTNSFVNWFHILSLLCIIFVFYRKKKMYNIVNCIVVYYQVFSKWLSTAQMSYGDHCGIRKPKVRCPNFHKRLHVLHNIFRTLYMHNVCPLKFNTMHKRRFVCVGFYCRVFITHAYVNCSLQWQLFVCMCAFSA